MTANCGGLDVDVMRIQRSLGPVVFQGNRRRDERHICVQTARDWVFGDFRHGVIAAVNDVVAHDAQLAQRGQGRDHEIAGALVIGIGIERGRNIDDCWFEIVYALDYILRHICTGVVLLVRACADGDGHAIMLSFAWQRILASDGVNFTRRWQADG